MRDRFRGGWGIGAWVLVGALGLGSIAAGFGAGRWWQGWDRSPAVAQWIISVPATTAQLAPASDGLFTLTMEGAPSKVLAVRTDQPELSELIPLVRLEREWRSMFGDDSVEVSLLIHDVTDPDPETSTTDRIELKVAEPVVDGGTVTYAGEVLSPDFINDDGVLRAFTQVTLILPDADRPVAGQ